MKANRKQTAVTLTANKIGSQVTVRVVSKYSSYPKAWSIEEWTQSPKRLPGILIAS